MGSGQKTIAIIAIVLELLAPLVVDVAPTWPRSGRPQIIYVLYISLGTPEGSVLVWLALPLLAKHVCLPLAFIEPCFIEFPFMCSHFSF